MSESVIRQATSLDDQLCFALYAASNTVVRAYRPLLGQLGLTYPQYLIMMVLWHEGPQTVSALAQRVQLPAHAVSPMLERMDANGFLARRRDAEDRRVVHVELTPAGRELERAVASVQDDVVCQTTLTADELAEMRSRLHDLVDRMTAPAGS